MPGLLLHHGRHTGRCLTSVTGGRNGTRTSKYPSLSTCTSPGTRCTVSPGYLPGTWQISHYPTFEMGKLESLLERGWGGREGWDGGRVGRGMDAWMGRWKKGTLKNGWVGGWMGGWKGGWTGERACRQLDVRGRKSPRRSSKLAQPRRAVSGQPEVAKPLPATSTRCALLALQERVRLPRRGPTAGSLCCQPTNIWGSTSSLKWGLGGILPGPPL